MVAIGAKMVVLKPYIFSYIKHAPHFFMHIDYKCTNMAWHTSANTI